MIIPLKELIEKINRKKYKRIMIQVPEGLKTQVVEISSEIKKDTKVEVFISAEPCYGACDLPLIEAELTDCDVIIHFGHSDFGVKTEIPVIYFPIYFDSFLSDKLKEELKKVKEEKVSVYSSEPFRKILNELEKYLLEIGKEVGEKKIILGCSKIKQKGEANIFVGSGKFHPLALKGDTYLLDVENQKLIDLTNAIRKEEMKKHARLLKLEEAKKVGILISTKPGQFYKDYKKLEKKLEKEGKETEILMFDEITNEKLMGLDFDVYLNTACPRILDNKFSKPIVNLVDLS